MKNKQAFPPPPVGTKHPVIPPLSKGVPPQLALQAENVEEGRATHIIGAVSHQPRGDLTTIMNEEDKIHHVRPIGFHSGVFKQAAKNYTVLEKEVTGLLINLESFAHFLEAAVCTYVLTDAQALLWALRWKNSGISKLERMCIRLLSMRFRIIITHIRGTANPADLLTRVVKVPENEYTLKDAKRAIVVHSPFQPGEIISPQRILDELHKNPHIIQLLPPNGEGNQLVKPRPKLAVTNQMLESVSQHQSVVPSQHLPIMGLHELRASTLHKELQRELTPAAISIEQGKDPFTAGIIEKINASPVGKYLSFRIDKGLLVHQRSPDQPPVPFVPDALVPFLCALFHLQNHCGAESLGRMISNHYYIFKGKEKILKFTRACSLCNRFRPSTQQKEQLGFAPLPHKKATQWHIDLVVGLPPHGGKDAYLTLLDPFSGFKQGIPCAKTITAKGIAGLLRLHIIAVFGVPELLVSDGGPNMLKAEALQQFCAFYGISTHVGVPYSAKSHGRVEAANKTISNLVQILAEQHDVPWPNILSLAIAALNAKPRVYFGGLSPHQILFGTVQNPVFPNQVDEAELISDTQQKTLFDNLDKEVNKRIKEAEEQMKKQNLQQGGIRTFFRPGSLVYTKDYRLLPHKKWKQKYFSAPFLVLKDYGTTVLLRSLLGTTTVAHKANCRPAHEREVESFDKLPFRTKAVLGPPFSPAEIEEAIRRNEVPEFWRQKQPVYEPPKTRGQAATEAAATASRERKDPLEENIPALPFQDVDDVFADAETQDESRTGKRVQEKRVRFRDQEGD